MNYFLLFLVLSICSVSCKNDIRVSLSAIQQPTLIAPTALTVVSPASTPYRDITPTLRVSGVENGDTVTIYRDSGCTISLASGQAHGTTVDLTTSNLTTGQTHPLYAKRSSNSQDSSCSSLLLNYEIETCPTGFIEVPGNTGLGTSLFCVMQYEAKGTTGNLSMLPASPVIVSVTSTTSFNECAALSETGYNGVFRLIATPEWMTIARNIELQNSNWSGLSVGTGQIPRGHSDSGPGSVLTISDTADPFDQTLNDELDPPGSGWEQKRTLNLSNGEVIWDFAGNAWEWTDWDASDATMTQGPTDTVVGWHEPTSLSGSLLPQHNQSIGGYDSSHGFGQWYGSGQGGPIRGGAYNRGTISGILAINFDANLATGYVTTSFRCVYIP